MPLYNGLYKVTLQTAAGIEYGVAYLLDGRLRGGDSGMAYVGNYAQEGDVFSAEVSVAPHRALPGAASLLGYAEVVVLLEGLSADGCAKLRGSARDVPGVRLTATLSLLAD